MLPDKKEGVYIRPITPIKQSMEASCVAASISMVFTGLGVNISEHELVDTYFPTAKLPAGEINSGVSNTNTVKGIVRIIADRDLKRSLDFDVFIPGLSHTYKTSAEQFIVVADPNSVRRYGRGFDKDSDVRKFFETLGRLSQEGELKVHTENAKALNITGDFRLGLLPESARRGFYQELDDFIQKGHIVGPHGGMTLHARALDGATRKPLDYDPSQDGFMLHDPRGMSYLISLSSLVMLDSFGARGDAFDFLFRLSPREERPKMDSSNTFLRKLRDLIL